MGSPELPASHGRRRIRKLLRTGRGVDDSKADLSGSCVEAEPSLDREEVRRRAVSGTILLSSNGFALQAIGFVVTVVFARVLGPTGMGVIAFGMTVMTLARFVGGGQAFAGALIRAQEDPAPADLHSLLGLQLILVGALATVSAAVCLAFGHVGRVTAVMLIALPIAAFRTPAAVLLERQLRYRAITIADAADTLTYYAWGLATLALGWGVWGIATAMVVRSVAGSVTAIALAPRRIVAPTLSLSRSRNLVGFASRVQAQELLEAFREQGVNLGTAAIGGLHVLGIWTLAYRFLQLPWMLFNSVLRVSFPAMSRLISMREDPRPIVRRTLRLAMLGNGLVVMSIISVGPALIPKVFGPEWSEAANVLGAAGIGVIIVAPVLLAFNGYLWAIGDASTPLRGALATGIVWPATTFALLPVVGVIGAGLGAIAGCIANAVVVTRGAERHLELHAGFQILRGIAAAVGAAAAGFVTAKVLGVGFPSAAAAELVALTTYCLALLVLDRSSAREAVGILRHARRGARLLVPARGGATATP